MLNSISGIDPQWSWMISVFVVVFLTTVGNFVARRLLARLAARLAENNSHWDDVLLAAASRPLTWHLS